MKHIKQIIYNLQKSAVETIMWKKDKCTLSNTSVPQIPNHPVHSSERYKTCCENQEDTIFNLYGLLIFSVQ